MNDTRLVRVWDAPTRIFHWSLVGLVVLSWLTGEEEGLASVIHRFSGEAIVGLLVFRFAWGFVGGEYARFSSFFAPPREIAAHVRELFSFRAQQTLGHNPLGALASIALMATVAATALTGLFSAGHEGPAGPFAALAGTDLSELHEIFFRILQGLVILHLAGVALTSFASRDNLVRAMITGRKRRETGAWIDAQTAAFPALFISIALAVAVSGVLMSLPHPGGEGHEHAEADEHDEDD